MKMKNRFGQGEGIGSGKRFTKDILKTEKDVIFYKAAVTIS